MNLIPLTAVPNQSVAFNVDGAYWQLRFYQAVDKMYADFSRDGAVLITGVRCFGGIGILPYVHLYLPSYGNFIFDGEVDWNNFGVSLNLYYLTLDEYKKYQALAAPRI